MSASGFALLWSKILDSSIWMESKETRLVWITMLAMKDSQGRVISSPKALAHRARVEPEACAAALVTFQSPDLESGSKAEEGRRIREIPGGWQIINHEEYRFSTEAKRAFWREQKRKQREAKKVVVMPDDHEPQWMSQAKEEEWQKKLKEATGSDPI